MTVRPRRARPLALGPPGGPQAGRRAATTPRTVNGMAWLQWLLRRRVVLVALKASIACGLAFYVGALLPPPVDDYKYYAALGAFTVVGLVLADSVKESVQVFGAVAVGVGVALVVQTLSWTNAVTVAVTIAIGVLLGAARLFGVQRTWAPLAALFVLATGGPDPEPMALGYLVQLPLGALIGILVNVLVFAPLGDDDLEPASAQALLLLSGQMGDYADLLEQQREAEEDTDVADHRDDVVHTNVVELEDAQARLRSAIVEARRAAKGNPRARLHARSLEAALDRAQAVNRCSAALLAVGVVLGQSGAPQDEHGVAVRRHAEEALRNAAEVFADPAMAEERPDLLRATEDSLDAMLHAVGGPPSGDGLDRVLFGALAVTIRDCLHTFARHVAEVDLPPAEGR